MTANAPAPTQSPDSESQTDAPPPAAAAKPVDPTDSPDAYQAALEAEVARRIDAVERRWQSRKDRELNRARRRWESEAGQVIDPELLAWIADTDPREVGQWLKTGLTDQQPTPPEPAAAPTSQPEALAASDESPPSPPAEDGSQSTHSDSASTADSTPVEPQTDGPTDAETAEHASPAPDVETRGRSPRTPGRTAQPGPLARPLFLAAARPPTPSSRSKPASPAARWTWRPTRPLAGNAASCSQRPLEIPAPDSDPASASGALCLPGGKAGADILTRLHANTDGDACPTGDRVA